MLRRTFLATALLAPAIGACASTGADPLAELPLDPDSYARPNEARVRHVSLDLTADFQRQRMRGAATLTIAARPHAREIVLDAHRLDIESITTNLGETSWTIGAHDTRKGAPLTIAITPGVHTIRIVYESGENAGALQWLAPAQTASAKPFLFSQGQSILNRSWIPLQDTPGVRITYDARIVAPADLVAVMSAEMLTPEGEAAAGGRAFRFRMPQPIPSYLIAVAIGELTHRDVGARTGVWAEPGVADIAAREFEDMPRMMQVAEALYGPYRWGRYDVLVLPASFPFGGMENPRVTFATPTLLAGDKSLVDVIAHELAHSWSGNLVTNAVWADGWLNEGFTSYIDDRICEDLFGEEQALMARALAWAELEREIARNTPDTTRLYGAASRVAYTKGALFLHTIERFIGRDRTDRYLRSYFDRHAFGPMTTAQFLADFRSHIVRGDSDLDARLMLDQWAYEPGLPANAEQPQSPAFARVDAAVAAFVAGGAANAPWRTWGAQEQQRYLESMPRALSAERLAALQAAYALNETGNAEVLFDWLELALRNGYEPAAAAAERFLTSMGRAKFVRPLYQALWDQGPWGRALAQRIYARARPLYHPIVQAQVDRIVAA
ncbi:MAG: M1 family metallopeptidase [Hyphomonadaceae bacterium]|nr:M1 family metallopeptidase [Hyphomonadaceae bacterium]MBX3511152.1 M1 family metallopeptidase [Hyphomonadaceae bacterium]